MCESNDGIDLARVACLSFEQESCRYNTSTGNGLRSRICLLASAERLHVTSNETFTIKANPGGCVLATQIHPRCR